ncbi:hypothetical protein DFR70_103356 [Nocardia tenerifensis]|uniref:Uncharacterized protein n=1 Tax=Nocardia tenerifensis TaxID=228006 RepID=A0A318KSZ6_9NOCA|nr:hypothetical protein DFR70_103356 [Nocardia tenerifensis]
MRIDSSPRGATDRHRREQRCAARSSAQEGSAGIDGAHCRRPVPLRAIGVGLQVQMESQGAIDLGQQRGRQPAEHTADSFHRYGANLFGLCLGRNPKTRNVFQEHLEGETLSVLLVIRMLVMARRVARRLAPSLLPMTAGHGCLPHGREPDQVCQHRIAAAHRPGHRRRQAPRVVPRHPPTIVPRLVRTRPRSRGFATARLPHGLRPISPTGRVGGPLRRASPCLRPTGSHSAPYPCYELESVG